MGAKMMPTAKKMGRTVFGVRMGLEGFGSGSIDAWLKRHSLPRLQSLLTKCSVCTGGSSAQILRRRLG